MARIMFSATTAFFLTILGSTAWSQEANNSNSSEVNEAFPTPWADARHPEIDYSTHYAEGLHEAGASFSGWWGTIKGTPDSGDADHVTSVNFSANEDPNDLDAALLVALCSQNDLYLIYFPRQLAEPHLNKANESSETPKDEDTESRSATDVVQQNAKNRPRTAWTVSTQLGAANPKNQHWESLGENNGVFITGASAGELIYDLRTEELRTLTLSLRDGAISNTFKIAGAKTALEPLIETCDLKH